MKKRLLRYTFVVIFAASSSIKIFDLENTNVLFTTITSFTSLSVRILITLSIMFEIGIGILVLVKADTNFYTRGLIYITLYLFLSGSIIMYIIEAENCGCFGTIIATSPLGSIIKNIGLILIFYYMEERKKSVRYGIIR